MSDAEYRSMIFRDILGTAYSTFNASNKDRTTNVKLAANFCNDTVLLPGQVFSYNDVVGPRTEERGFKKASVYVGDTVQNGLGGGICQVTSTLYLATLYSDLEIVERYNHSRDVPYVPDGLDATVVYGSKDFKFKNNGEFPIRIQMIVRNNKLTVNVYGTQTVPGKQVKMEVVELSRDPAKLKEVLDTSMAPGTYRISGSVYDGYKSQSYRVVYINGVEYSRTEEAISKYTRYDYTATKYYNPAPAGPETPQPGTGGGVAEGGNEPDPA
jgi:vancomycin resistance protein YoaR